MTEILQLKLINKLIVTVVKVTVVTVTAVIVIVVIASKVIVIVVIVVADGAFGHKIHYVTIFMEILNPEGNLNCVTDSKVTANLLNVRILPIGGALSGRVCACSLRSRLV